MYILSGFYGRVDCCVSNLLLVGSARCGEILGEFCEEWESERGGKKRKDSMKESRRRSRGREGE